MGSFEAPMRMQSPALLETSCGYLLQELQCSTVVFFFFSMSNRIIWDEVGEHQYEREKVLLDLEQKCLEANGRKRARLHQQLAESEAKLIYLLIPRRTISPSTD
ncbi:hypothetical protein RJ641_012909 [Dillenia turbinata]|uniref:Uncharacterized protein n=1 Tax=Dillenia turbinata TaxID=194707 RepID=A0AAN8V491_9MAGN